MRRNAFSAALALIFALTTAPAAPPGTVVGSYFDSLSMRQAFLLKGGIFQTLVVPGSTNDWAFGINLQGDIVGQYDDALGNTHGFLYTPLLVTRPVSLQRHQPDIRFRHSP
jgi:probable HAF family extracellular repeat protein